MTTNVDNDIDSSTEKVSGIAANILEQFFTELAKEPSLNEVASNLRHSILSEAALTETKIKNILFQDIP